MTIGIILAAGRGKRFGEKNVNKVAVPVGNKPIVAYGVEGIMPYVDMLYVVIGHESQSVISALKGFDVEFVTQTKRLGTGHAIKCALTAIGNDKKIDTVLIGHGDAMALYEKSLYENMINTHKKTNSTLTLLTSTVTQPGKLGRIIHNKTGRVIGNVEYKDATDKEREIKTVNIAFYCVDYAFLKANINKIKKSKVSGEYYLTDLIELASCTERGVSEVNVPFESVGLGVNTKEDLVVTESLLKSNVVV